MTEKERSHRGELYYANSDRELIAERIDCKGLCYEFNQLHPSRIEEREAILRKILGKAGKNIWVEQPFFCDYGYNITAGDNLFLNHNCQILDCTKVQFGDNVFVAPNCCLSTAGHPLDSQQRNTGLEFAKPIVIGDNVWIGASVTIIPGVTIGNDTVIGAGSVVTKDIPSGVIAVGNPCRVLREITEADRYKYGIRE